MKLSAIMLFVFASMVFAAKGYSQSVRVTLNVNNSSLQKVLDEIEKQSEFHFFYNNKQVDISRNVTIKSNQKEISQVLNQDIGEQHNPVSKTDFGNNRCTTADH